MKKFINFRIFLISIIFTILIVLGKYLLHHESWEVIVLGSLHGSVISGAFFVIGFLLSATIADYKESERIPSNFSGTVENMYEDGVSIKKNYPKFKLDAYREQLREITKAFRNDARTRSRSAHKKIHALSSHFAHMEKVGVPPNFITKLKQQQAQILVHTQRVSYIQRITFIPSATILARSIVAISLLLLVFTEIEPFYGGLLITSGIAFSMIYILKLISVISTPFHDSGKTQDDVSMFLLNETIRDLKK